MDDDMTGFMYQWMIVVTMDGGDLYIMYQEE